MRFDENPTPTLGGDLIRTYSIRNEKGKVVEGEEVQVRGFVDVFSGKYLHSLWYVQMGKVIPFSELGPRGMSTETCDCFARHIGNLKGFRMFGRIYEEMSDEVDNGL